jgi:hypothetical protein
MNDVQREMLLQFFAGYFHQDWDLDAESPEQVLDNYRRKHTREERQALSQAITEYVQTFSDDKELDDDLFFKLDCSYDPTAHGLSTRDWLKSVAAQLVTTDSPGLTGGPP